VNDGERAIRFDGIKQIGCICCRLDGFDWTYAEVHHLLTTGFHGNGKRLGDEFTIGLCLFHHRGIRDDSCRWAEGPSYFSQAADFRERYGNDAELLLIQNEFLRAMEFKPWAA